MTREEILALHAGEQLDELFAVKMFGLDEEELHAVNIFGGRRLPNYSTTWEGARIVVEAMYKRGWRLRLDQSDDGTFDAVFYPQHTSRTKIAAVCVMLPAPHVVTLAALLALEANHATR